MSFVPILSFRKSKKKNKIQKPNQPNKKNPAYEFQEKKWLIKAS